MSLHPARIVSLPFVLVLLCCLQIHELAHAEKVTTDRWNISADKLLRYDTPNSIVAQGNVILEKKEKYFPKTEKALKTSSWSELLEEKDTKTEKADEVVKQKPEYRTAITISADWIVYDVEKETIKAKGDVKITTAEDQLYAKEATLSLANETGQFTDAKIVRKELSMHLEGKSIEKTGFNTYRVIDGWVITCKLENGETPPWSLASSKADVEQGGYARLRNALFKIRDIPVFYLPYVILPAKNTRQSGFLFPEFTTSKAGGSGIGIPFFLNISDSADLTLFPDYYFNRGLMAGAEFRYVLSDRDKGMFTGNFLDDKLSDPSETDYYRTTGYTHDNNERYWLRGKADQNFGNWQTRVDIDIVSDQDYLREFGTGATGFDNTYTRYLKTFGRGFQNDTDVFRQNTVKALRTWSGMALEADLLAIDDTETNPSKTDTPLWKLPNVIFSGAQQIGESTFTVDWNADYVDYWREDGVGGQRVDARPAISTPVRISPYLESRAEVALRDTYYYVQSYGDAEWNKGTSQNRFLPELTTEVATTLERDYFLGGNGKSPSFAHQIRPYVKYGYIPDVDQADLPDFDTTDFIEDKNAITYGFDNFYLAYDEGGLTTKQLASLKIEQPYDLRSAKADEPFGPIFGRLIFHPMDRIAVDYKTFFDVYEGNFTSHTFTGDYGNGRGDRLILEYSYKEKTTTTTDTKNIITTTTLEEINQINVGAELHIWNEWYAGGLVQHSIANDDTNKAKGSITYRALCWALQFETRYTPEDTTYLLLFSLANIGSPFGVNL